MKTPATFAATLLDRFGKWTEAQPKSAVFAICLILTLLIGFVDYLAGRVIALSGIYAIPISISAWFLGKQRALFLAAISVALWIWGDQATGAYESDILIPSLNAVFRFCFYWLLITVLVQLATLQETLEVRAAQRGAALAKEVSERERLEREMLEISERERQRFGQDIHDGLCQHLTGTALTGHVLAEKLSAKSAPEAADANKIVSLIEEGILLARGMAKGLYPVQTEPDGLMQALEEFASTNSQMFGVDCRFECHSPVLIHTAVAATHLYRIAQEAVGNAIKHGGATRITILLEDGKMGLRLVITDNGKGFHPHQESEGMGMSIMSDRAKVIGGVLSVKSRIQGGVEVTCVVPATKEAGGVHA